jgi:hypothetical protein
MGACWILGVGHGLWLAWTQPVRIDHWAKRAVWAQRKIHELEDRADGIPTDRELFGLRDLARLETASADEAGRAAGGDSNVHPLASHEVVNAGQGPSAVIAS